VRVKTEAIEAIRSLVGVRFRHQGRNPATGLDCVGLGLQYAKALGLPLRDRKAYSRDPDGKLRDSICHVMGPPVAEGPGCGALVQEGDVVMMEWSPGVPRHVAMITEKAGLTHVIHADSEMGRVVEHRLSDEWRARIVAVWRPEA
jgi:cell wall-associated NlpC family hydrolase